MEVFVILLLLSFVAGGRNARRGRTDRALVVLGSALLVALLLSTRRFV